MTTLTKRAVDAVTPSASPTFIWDDQLAGFGLKVLPDGKRRYVVKYRVRGGRQARQRWFMLGSHGQITCEEARAQAKQILSAVARGEDPQGERAAGRAAPSVADLWARYEAEHLPRKKTQSGRDDKQKAADYLLPALGRLRVADVTRSDIQRLHQRLSDRPYQANRVLALASKMFNLAELWGMRPDGSNPCRHIERFKEQARQRYLSPSELERLGAALRAAEDVGEVTSDMAAAVKLLLLTGARLNEILGARWEWVDWERKVIDLPDSKTGAKPLFLSDQALDVLRGQRSLGEDEKAASSFVVKGRLAKKPLVNLAKPWKRLCQRADLRGVRLHDLRHTAASIGVASGLSLPIIGRLLGHTQSQTTQRYAHVATDPALVAANTIGAAISGFLRPESEKA